MSLNLQEKQAVVAEVAKQVAGAQAIVMAENRGMPVAAMTQLRDNPGPGRDTIMAATLRGLSDADLGALAHHLATFKP